MKRKKKKFPKIRIGKEINDLFHRKAGPMKHKNDKRSKNKDQKKEWLRDFEE